MFLALARLGFHFIRRHFGCVRVCRTVFLLAFPKFYDWIHLGNGVAYPIFDREADRVSTSTRIIGIGVYRIERRDYLWADMDIQREN